MREYKRMWEFKQSAEPSTLEIYIYGDIESDDYDWWTGAVIESETSAKAFRKELEQHPDTTEIKLYINSYGGSVFEGTAIYSQLRRHPAHITAYIDGFACSIASVIAMSADKVIMPKNAMMMIHNAWQYACGNAAELRKAADDLDKINTGSMQAYLNRCKDKLPEDKLTEMLDAETWLTAAECIEYGFADEYAEQDADMSKAAEVLQKANLNVQQRLNVQKSLMAQLRQISEDIGNITAEPEPKEPPEPKPAENQAINFLSALAQMGGK